MADDIAPRVRPPSKEQLAAITDRGALVAIRDALADEAIRIETDLEFRPGDADWAERARTALYFHRVALRHANNRLRDMGKPKGGSGLGHRADSDCEPLTLTLLKGFHVEADTLATEAECAAAVADLDRRIEALQRDRADENDRPTLDKDHPWLQRAKIVLTKANQDRHALTVRQGLLRRAEAQAAPRASTTRQQMFIDASREVLDRETYLAIWEIVDLREGA